MRIVGSTGNVCMGYTSESNPGDLNLQFNSNSAQGLTITNSNGSSFIGHYLLFNNSSNSPIGSVNNTFVTPTTPPPTAVSREHRDDDCRPRYADANSRRRF